MLQFGNLGEVEIEFGFVVYQVEIFGEGLYYVVFDVVVNYFGEVFGVDWVDVCLVGYVLWCQCFEDGLYSLGDFGCGVDYQVVVVFQVLDVV